MTTLLTLRYGPCLSLSWRAEKKSCMPPCTDFADFSYNGAIWNSATKVLPNKTFHRCCSEAPFRHPKTRLARGSIALASVPALLVGIWKLYFYEGPLEHYSCFPEITYSAAAAHVTRGVRREGRKESLPREALVKYKEGGLARWMRLEVGRPTLCLVSLGNRRKWCKFLNSKSF